MYIRWTTFLVTIDALSVESSTNCSSGEWNFKTNTSFQKASKESCNTGKEGHARPSTNRFKWTLIALVENSPSNWIPQRSWLTIRIIAALVLSRIKLDWEFKRKFLFSHYDKNSCLKLEIEYTKNVFYFSGYYLVVRWSQNVNMKKVFLTTIWKAMRTIFKW